MVTVAVSLSSARPLGIRSLYNKPASLCGNITYHGATEMAHFEAVYGLSLISYLVVTRPI